MVENNDIGVGHHAHQFSSQTSISAVEALHDTNKQEDTMAASRWGATSTELENSSESDEESIGRENPTPGASGLASNLNRAPEHPSASFSISRSISSQSQLNSIPQTGNFRSLNFNEFSWPISAAPMPVQVNSQARPSVNDASTDISSDESLSINGAYDTPMVGVSLGNHSLQYEFGPASDQDTSSSDQEMSSLDADFDLDDILHDEDEEFDDPWRPDQANETAGGWHGGHWCEGMENGSLIEHADLSCFELDKLPGPVLYTGDRYDEPREETDTERFYVSDDEILFTRPSRRYRESITPTHDMGDDMDSDDSLTGRPQVMPQLHPPDEIPITHDDLHEYYDDDDDLGELSMHIESMNKHFLDSVPFLFTPAFIDAFASFSDFIYCIAHASINVKHESHEPACLLELVSSSSLYHSFHRNAPPRILEVLGDSFLLDRAFLFEILRRGIFIRAPVILPRDTLGPVQPAALDTTQIPFEQRTESEHPSEPLRFEERPPPLSPGSAAREVTVADPENGTQSSVQPPTSSIGSQRPLLTESQYRELHRLSEHSLYYIPPKLILQFFDSLIASSVLATPLAPYESESEFHVEANEVAFSAFERNLTVDQFIRQWFIRSRLPHRQLGMKEQFLPISEEASRVLSWSRPASITRPDNARSSSFDIQGIPWSHRLKVRREDARYLRDKLYTPYHNLGCQPRGMAMRLPQTEKYFRPKAMYTNYKASMAHFQLRNLMSVTASNTVQYACRSKIHSVIPFYNEQNCFMDLSEPSGSTTFFDSVKISTMKAKHGVTAVGGFCGEYAYKGEITDYATTEGSVTRNINGITNHIDIVKHRTSDVPHAVISSNDMSIRVLDCERNQFVQVQKFARAVNCTDTSPDGRLRVIVGDSADSWIVDSDTGKPIQSLSGHHDYGFACAWSPDMLHIATGNQDRTVNIWDARMWRTIQTIDSDVAGYRSLRFSPVGGGPRTLLMCEPADRICLVNAQTYQTRQVFDFFGEIGGADFTPDGGRIWVANMDVKFGGLMEFDRAQWGQEFGIGHTKRRRIESRGDIYYPDLPNEWIPEDDLDDDARCALGPGERKLRYQRLDSNW